MYFLGKWFKEIFLDVDGHGSSKRIITILAFIFLSIGYFAHIFFGKVIGDTIWEGMLWVVMAGMGVATVEKFSRKGVVYDNSEPESEPELEKKKKAKEEENKDPEMKKFFNKYLDLKKDNKTMEMITEEIKLLMFNNKNLIDK